MVLENTTFNASIIFEYIWFFIFQDGWMYFLICIKYPKKMSWEWFFLRIYKRTLTNFQVCSMNDNIYIYNIYNI